jgi:hypothetical protein
MKISQSELKQIIKEEITKIREGVEDIDFSQASQEGEIDSEEKSKPAVKKDVSKEGMSFSDARSYAKSFLRKKDKDPDILDDHAGFRNFLRDNVKTYWPSESESEIKQEIRYWISKNILNIKKRPADTKKKKKKSPTKKRK